MKVIKNLFAKFTKKNIYIKKPVEDFIPPQGYGQRREVPVRVSHEVGSLITLFALILVLSFLVLFYTKMRIEVSLLDRKIKQARMALIEQERKNASLRSELARKKGEDAVLTYWKLYGALPDYEKNRVLRIRLSQ
jgi:hypothetical protein